MGPFAGFAENEEHMLRVLRMHRDEAAKIDEELVPAELLAAGPGGVGRGGASTPRSSACATARPPSSRPPAPSDC